MGGADLGDQSEGERGVMRSLASSCVTFAAGIAARHVIGEAPMRLPQLSRVLRRMRGSIVTRTGGNVTFAPHIDVRLAAFGRTTSDAHLVARRDGVITGRTEHRTVSAPSAEAMIQRSSVRSVRSDEAAARSRRAFGAPPAVLAERSPFVLSTTQVPRVLRRRGVAPVDDASPPPRDERSLRLPSQPPRPQQLSPVEVARLTDHIVHTIDRRIAAFRERQGRV